MTICLNLKKKIRTYASMQVRLCENYWLFTSLVYSHNLLWNLIDLVIERIHYINLRRASKLSEIFTGSNRHQVQLNNL